MRPSARPLLIAVLALVTAGLAGCVAPAEIEPAQNEADDSESPSFAPPEVVEGLELLASLELPQVNEITLRDNYAYVSTYGGAYVVDVSDPANPVELSNVPCRGIHVRVVDLEERRVMTLGYQGDDGCEGSASSGGIRLVDVTDPANPVIGKQVPLKFGSHTHTPYGDTGILYNSAYNLRGNVLEHHRSEIVDITDWENPQVVGEHLFSVESASPGCHDMVAEPERDRVICAAITETQIWDTSDPLAPEMVHILRNPLISIHHTAQTARDGDLLIIGDEWTGALGPGCFDGGVAPIGAVWFYDISTPTDPKLQGYLAPPHLGPEVPCTAHNFNVVEGHDVLVAGFFKAGTVLIDFSDPTNPTVVDKVQPDGTDVWAAYYHNGHVFTGDRGRGLDVMTFA